MSDRKRRRTRTHSQIDHAVVWLHGYTVAAVFGELRWQTNPDREHVERVDKGGTVYTAARTESIAEALGVNASTVKSALKTLEAKWGGDLAGLIIVEREGRRKQGAPNLYHVDSRQIDAVWEAYWQCQEAPTPVDKPPPPTSSTCLSPRCRRHHPHVVDMPIPPVVKPPTLESTGTSGSGGDAPGDPEGREPEPNSLNLNPQAADLIPDGTGPVDANGTAGSSLTEPVASAQTVSAKTSDAPREPANAAPAAAPAPPAATTPPISPVGTGDPVARDVDAIRQAWLAAGGNWWKSYTGVAVDLLGAGKSVADVKKTVEFFSFPGAWDEIRQRTSANSPKPDFGVLGTKLAPSIMALVECGTDYYEVKAEWDAWGVAHPDEWARPTELDKRYDRAKARWEAGKLGSTRAPQAGFDQGQPAFVLKRKGRFGK